MFERGKLTVVIGDSGAGKEYVVECYEKKMNRINVVMNYDNPQKKIIICNYYSFTFAYLSI